MQAFLVGGLLCLINNRLVDKTSLTPARILVSYVVAGVILGAVGLYEPIAEFGGAGATVPLTDFGYNLAKGVRQRRTAFSFTGGLKAAAGTASPCQSWRPFCRFDFRPKS